MIPSRSTTAFLAAAFIATACADVPSAVSPHASMHVGASLGSSPVNGAPGLAQQVKAAASRYNSTKQAEKAGYVGDPTCVAVPSLGGMGHHWVNMSLVDPVFDPLQPEVLVYAPTKNGGLKLVAVEYIVINVGQPAPTFDGRAFDVGGTPVPVAHWSLHVWAFETNPNGMFTPFNPNVSCTP